MTENMGDELLSLGMARLAREPSKLHAESHQVEQMQQAHSVENYSVFIINQECVENVKTGCSKIREGLENLHLELGNLKQILKDAEGEVMSIQKRYTTNRQTLQHHAQLADLLDVPYLMDACVRNGLYDESLKLAEFIKALEQRYFTREIQNNKEGEEIVDKDIAEKIPSIIHTIAAEVSTLLLLQCFLFLSSRFIIGCVMRVTLKTMINYFFSFVKVKASLQLLHRNMLFELSGKIQLAACLRIVPCLKRLETLFSSRVALQTNVDLHVQVEFIEARDRWFLSLLDDPTVRSRNIMNPAMLVKDPYASLMDYMESCRTAWFEIATQFRAIFGGDQNRGVGSFFKGSTKMGSSSNNINDSSEQVLSAWLGRRVEIFLAQLRAVLPFIKDGASLANALEQAMFFGMSMGRLGFDFRGLLIQCFENATLDSAILKWKDASTTFLAGLAELEEKMRCSTKVSATVTHLRIRGLGLSKTIEEKAAGDKKGEGGVTGLMGKEGNVKSFSAAVISPPIELLSFPLLARLTNTLLASFNVLRECAPISMEVPLWNSLAECLRVVIIGLASFNKMATALLVKESDTFSQEGVGEGSGGVSVQIQIQTVKEAQASMTAASEALANCVVPHVMRCFSILFSNGGTVEQQCNNEILSPVARRVKEQLMEEVLKSELLLSKSLPLSTIVDNEPDSMEEGI
eukprot:170249_1